MLNVSTGCEPYFALSFNRRTETMSGETYKVEIGAVEEYRKATGNLGELPNYFITSSEIHWKDRVDMQAALQTYCDTAISSTVNLPKETTVEDIKNLYIHAWKKGCKGITVYREGSRDPILSTEPKKEENISEQVPLNTENAKLQVSNSHELKRGEIIKPGDHWLGLKRTLITGCGTLHVTAYFDPNTGDLRECYLSKGSTGGCNNFMVGLSRMISLSARGGIGIDAILDQLKSCGVCPSYSVRSATKKDTSKGSCCPVAVGNALKDMHQEIQQIICDCNNSPTYTVLRDSIAKTQPISGGVKVWPLASLKKAGIKLEDASLEDWVNIKNIPKTENQSYAEAVYEYVNNLKEEEQSLEECPSCHEKTLIHQGGCIGCTSCGFSRCS